MASHGHYRSGEGYIPKKSPKASETGMLSLDFGLDWSGLSLDFVVLVALAIVCHPPPGLNSVKYSKSSG
jgi:hypothetical protein